MGTAMISQFGRRIDEMKPGRIGFFPLKGRIGFFPLKGRIRINPARGRICEMGLRMQIAETDSHQEQRARRGGHWPPPPPRNLEATDGAVRTSQTNLKTHITHGNIMKSISF
jgi:hypothetical protein